MNGNTALDLLMQRLGNRTEVGLRSQCLTEMNLIQETELEAGAWRPWFLLSEEEHITVTPLERRVLVPSNFIAEYEDSHLYVTTIDGKEDIKLKKGELDDMARDDFGRPEFYTLTNRYYQLYPTPDLAYTILMTYYKKDAPVSDSAVANKWLTYAPDLLIAMTGTLVAGITLQDDKLAARFGEAQTAARTRLYQLDQTRRETNLDRYMGSPN